jgi:Zn-dependent protease with chaperone function
MKRLLTGLGALALMAAPIKAQTTTQLPQPGFNLFSVQQDIDIGRQSAVEAEKELPMLRNANVDRYLNRIVTRLAAQAPGARYPYAIKAVNNTEINAFALPGGPMYVHRGLLETARSEAELAGVLAHEMAHVALRHGTHQASKAYLTQSGLGLLGGLIGRPSGSTARILNTIGGVGLNAVFLKFSRDDEYEADQVGARIMAQAGYDPLAMASLFELLRAEQGRNPSKLETFFSSHPSSADREARIRQLAGTLGGGRTQVIGGFATMQTSLRSLAAAPNQPATITEYMTPDTVVTERVDLRVPAPSSRFVRFSQMNGFFTIERPDNWNVYPSGFAVSMAPEGGVHTRSDGQPVLLYGVVVNHYVPFAGTAARLRASLQRSYVPFEDRTASRPALEDATDDLVRTILAANPYLRAPSGVTQPETIAGQVGYSLVLYGVSPVTGQEERVTLYTRALPDGHVFYALMVAPAQDYAALQSTFQRMIGTIQVNDAAAHRR